MSNIEVTIKKTEPRTVAFVAMKGPYAKIPEAFPRLFGWIVEKGYVPAGPPSGMYFNAPGEVPDEELLWEIQCPIGGEVASSGPDERGLGVKRVEGAEVAATMYKGPFDQVGPTWEALAGWVMENGYEFAGAGEEVYLSDPEKTPPEDLLTELRGVVRKR